MQAICQRRDLLRSEFPLSPDFSVLCPLTGNIKKPTISTYLASDQTLHIFSLRLFPRSIKAYGFSGSSSSDSLLIPCPYNTTWGAAEPVPHITVPTGRFVYRAFASTPSQVNFALCAQDRCNTCGATFLHSNTVVLSRLPRFAAKCMSISLEGNDGDPGLIVSECVVNEARANERMRQGALNTEKKCRESVGDRAVRASLCYYEHAHAYIASLEKQVGDVAWGRIPVNIKNSLIVQRAELQAYIRGARFELWPSIPPATLLASPVLNR